VKRLDGLASRSRPADVKRDSGRARGGLTSVQIVILKGQMVTALHDKEFEAKARSMLRETIERSGWYPALHGPKHQQLIERDVEQHWHLALQLHLSFTM
jgi:hypothetical protein